MAALAEFSRPPGADAPATAALRRALAGAESPETLQTLAAQQPEWMRGAAGRELRAAARMRLRAPSSRLNPSQVKSTFLLSHMGCSCKKVSHVWVALIALIMSMACVPRSNSSDRQADQELRVRLSCRSLQLRRRWDAR